MIFEWIFLPFIHFFLFTYALKIQESLAFCVLNNISFLPCKELPSQLGRQRRQLKCGPVNVPQAPHLWWWVGEKPRLSCKGPFPIITQATQEMQNHVPGQNGKSLVSAHSSQVTDPSHHSILTARPDAQRGGESMEGRGTPRRMNPSQTSATEPGSLKHDLWTTRINCNLH